MKLSAKIEQLETLSRTRALSDKESRQLEDCLRRAGMLPKRTANVCSNGHAIENDNAAPAKRGAKQCRICRNEYSKRYAKTFASNVRERCAGYRGILA